MNILNGLTSILFRRPHPPDLSDCTRLEVRLAEGAMVQFFTETKSIFNDEETRYIHSCDTWIVDDPDVIRNFAEDLGKGKYWRQESYSRTPAFEVVCYQDATCVTTLDVDDGIVTTKEGMSYRYPRGLPKRSILTPPGITRLKPRWECAMTMRDLARVSPQLGGEDGFFPDPSRWSDAIVECLQQQHTQSNRGPRRRTYSDAMIARRLRCPNMWAHEDATLKASQIRGDRPSSADESDCSWVSDYAMNPNCTPDSPPDMVLLFESRPGWNQHGGPELFTFDNHDPKGGCVLLHSDQSRFDGDTVLFIRTEEELHALRWE